MNFYTTSTFRESLLTLLKKRKDGYSTVVDDICSALHEMPLNILRDTNERIIQTPLFRIVKYRLPNTGQKLSKANGFRLIYYVSLVTDDVVLLRIYPKRGPHGVVDLLDAEYLRLISELTQENLAKTLQQVDITNALAELSLTASMSIESE